MSNEEMVEALLSALPADGSAVSNKRLQEGLGWSKTDYERIRDLASTAKRVKRGPGQGGTLRRNTGSTTQTDGTDDADPNTSTEAGDTESQTPEGLQPPASPKEEFALQLHLDVEARIKAGRRTYEQSLIEYAFESLGDDQFDEPEAFSYVDEDSFSGEVRFRIDGYDLHDDEDNDDDAREIIDLFVVHAAPPVRGGTEAAPTVVIPTFEGAPVNALFRTVRRFVEESRRELHRELTHNTEARDVARSIKASRNLKRVHINLVTNAEVRQFDRSVETVDGVEVVKRALDINYLRRLFSPDAIEVDFSAAQTGGIPCVPLPDKNGTYRSFLAVVPGAFLYQLYDKYKQRLLEANVRSYLRASGKSVNQRIIDTIRKTPEMFFAFNNGITATADELVVEATPEGGWALVRCRNLQIVNGGQTTASLFHANLRKISLDRVFVPMKINEVLDPSRAAEVVQQISLYANSQNKVNLSDFGANQVFHVKLQKLAQQEIPPVPALGVSRNAQWFYERMRGEYKTAVSLERTKAKKRDFQLRFPKEQVITKTDVARYAMIWAQRPQNACLGAEKNYQRFRQLVDGFEPDAEWFHELVAKALLTEHCDALVVDSKIPGYKSNIVAYSVALLSHVRGKEMDLEAIWKAQRVDDETSAWLTSTIELVRAHITKPPREGMNVNEWSKKEDCWKQLVALWNARAT